MVRMCKSNYVIKEDCVTALTFSQDRKHVYLLNIKVTKLLQDRHRIPFENAVQATQTFLRNFRLCPDNCEMSLDKWRHLLWSRALGDKYANLAGTVYKEWLELRYKYVALSPEIKSMLLRLRQHFHLALITNGPSNAQWEKIRRLDLMQYFDCVLVSGDLLWEKPDKHIFLEACRYLQTDPQRCIMVGDKLETDVLGGIRASLGATIWTPLSVQYSLTEDDPRPDFILKDVTDLPRLLSSSAELHAPRLILEMSSPDLEDCSSNSSDGS